MRWIAIAMLALGCQGNDAKPVTGSASAATTPLEDRGLATIDKLADVFVADGSDCDKLADDVTAFGAAHSDVFTAIKQMTVPEGSARDAFQARNAERMAGIKQKMSGAVQACGSNAKLAAAMATLLR